MNAIILGLLAIGTLVMLGGLSIMVIMCLFPSEEDGND
jgi:hypothetical protein